MNNLFYVYILASKKDGVLYVGVTNNLLKRTHQHQQEEYISFTTKYHVHRLVYYEQYSDINEAILREKRLKKWNRKWKINLVEQNNSEWQDLTNQLSE